MVSTFSICREGRERFLCEGSFMYALENSILTCLHEFHVMYITEVYDDGYLRGDGGVCVATDSDSQGVGRTVLVAIYFVLSLLVALEWCVSAALWRWGSMDSSSKSTDRQAIVHVHVYIQ